LSLEVETGVVYGFLGPNGAGKSTTMRILSGLSRPDQGQASILGTDIRQPGLEIRNLIGVLLEEPAFYSWMTAREYLQDFIAPLHGIPPKSARQRAGELLETVNLTKAADRRLQGFSRGMRQRLGLAGALIHRPPVLLLDEPVSALDPAGRKEVLDLIETLRGKTTILLSTHILADVERVCDVIGIIDKGRLITQERRTDLLKRYASPLIEIDVENGFGDWLKQVQTLPIIKQVFIENHTARLMVSDLHAAQAALLKSLAHSGLLVQRFEIVQPSLEDIFLRLTHNEA
jgi:ABC-2 type transport system ATP-binding protein